MTNRELINNILNKYTAKYPNAPDLEEYTEYVTDMTRTELELENTLIADWIMALDYETLEELAMGRVSDLVDQLVHHQANGDEVMMAIVHQEIKDITRAMDSDDSADHFFYVTDYRYLD